MTVDHPPIPGSALWVLAHPRRQSLSGHLFRAGVQAMSRSRDVATSDLYAQGFDPVLGEHDLGEPVGRPGNRSEEHTSELQSRGHLVCRLLLEKKKTTKLRE